MTMLREHWMKKLDKWIDSWMRTTMMTIIVKRRGKKQPIWFSLYHYRVAVAARWIMMSRVEHKPFNKWRNLFLRFRPKWIRYVAMELQSIPIGITRAKFGTADSRNSYRVWRTGNTNGQISRAFARRTRIRGISYYYQQPKQYDPIHAGSSRGRRSRRSSTSVILRVSTNCKRIIAVRIILIICAAP